MSAETKKEALEFVRTKKICHFATIHDGNPVIRVMETVKTDNDFTFWFATGAASNKVVHIQKNPNICITYYDDGVFLRAFGKVEILKDKETKHKLWQEDWKAYFKSKDDPCYVILKMKPESVEFYDMNKPESDPCKLV